MERVELVDEVEEDSVLLARGGGLGRAEGCFGFSWVVVRRWGGEGDGESGESDGEERGDVHDCVFALVDEREAERDLGQYFERLEYGAKV